MWFAASFFLHLLHVARAAKRWSACQQGAGKRLVFNLVRTDSIAWNCGRKARAFVLTSDFSAARRASSLSTASSPCFLSLFFARAFCFTFPTSACHWEPVDQNRNCFWPQLDQEIPDSTLSSFRPKFSVFKAIFLRTHVAANLAIALHELFVFSNKFVFREIPRFDRW